MAAAGAASFLKVTMYELAFFGPETRRTGMRSEGAPRTIGKREIRATVRIERISQNRMADVRSSMKDMGGNDHGFYNLRKPSSAAIVQMKLE
jgi:hypothetical protein